MSAATGYRQPPKEHRFRKGRSGNPAGRPKGSRNVRRRRAHVFDEIATMVVKGKRVSHTNGDWIVLIARGLATRDRNKKLARMLTTFERRMKKLRRRLRPRGIVPLRPQANFRNDGRVHNTNEAVRALELGTLMWRTDARARIMLDTWIVQMALNAMGERRLSENKQCEVLRHTRSAHRLELPDWWSPDVAVTKRGRVIKSGVEGQDRAATGETDPE